MGVKKRPDCRNCIFTPNRVFKHLISQFGVPHAVLSLVPASNMLCLLLLTSWTFYRPVQISLQPLIQSLPWQLIIFIFFWIPSQTLGTVGSPSFISAASTSWDYLAHSVLSLPYMVLRSIRQFTGLCTKDSCFKIIQFTWHMLTYKAQLRLKRSPRGNHTTPANTCRPSILTACVEKQRTKYSWTGAGQKLFPL